MRDLLTSVWGWVEPGGGGGGWPSERAARRSTTTKDFTHLKRIEINMCWSVLILCPQTNQHMDPEKSENTFDSCVTLTRLETVDVKWRSFICGHTAKRIWPRMHQITSECGAVLLDHSGQMLIPGLNRLYVFSDVPPASSHSPKICRLTRGWKVNVDVVCCVTL